MSQKHVLIITYYWPPAGGPGVQRWLKFASYLPENGIIPIVYCPENPSYPILDASLEEEVPGAIEVLKRPIKEPYKMASLLSSSKTKRISSGIIPPDGDQGMLDKLLLFVRGNFFIPDARRSWIKPSVDYLRAILIERAINCIITTGPPHSLHLIGLRLKEELKVHWIADFRDPWTTIGYHKSLRLLKHSQQKHLSLEKQVLNNADELIVTSSRTKSEFEAKTKTPVTVITNGYDHHDVKVKSLDPNFSISHIGSLLSERNPDILWKVLSALVKENDSFAEHLKLNMIGVISQEVVDSIHSHGLADHLNILGYLPHKKAIEHQMRSQVLLLIEIDSEDTKAIIPGKLFEYLQAERPILAIGPEGSDVASIISGTNSGSYFNYDSEKELKQFIETSFKAFKEDALRTNSIGIQRYSRSGLTSDLATILKKYL